MAGEGEEPADRIPPLSGFVSIEYAPPTAFSIEARASMSASQDRLSDRDVSDSRINPEGTPGWTSIGLRGTWEPSARWELSVQFSNVLDKRYRVHGSGIDAVGRNITVAVRRRWQ
jgi:outer membrane receptor protein involved in Fe transport